MIRRLTVIVLSIFLLSALSAYGNSASSSNNTDSSVQQTQTTKEEQTDETVNEPRRKWQLCRLLNRTKAGLQKMV